MKKRKKKKISGQKIKLNYNKLSFKILLLRESHNLLDKDSVSNSLMSLKTNKLGLPPFYKIESKIV